MFLKPDNPTPLLRTILGINGRDVLAPGSSERDLDTPGTGFEQSLCLK